MKSEDDQKTLDALNVELEKMNISMDEMKEIAVMYRSVPTAISVFDNYSNIKDEVKRLRDYLFDLRGRNDLLFKEIEGICLQENAIDKLDKILESDKTTIHLENTLDKIKKKGKPFDDVGVACTSFYLLKLINSKDIESDITQKEKLNSISNILSMFDLKVPKRLDKTIADFENYLLNRPEVREAIESLFDAKFRP